MSTPPRIEPTLHPVPGAPLPVVDPELRPTPRRGQSPWEPPRPSFAGHIALALLTLLGLLLLLIVLLRWLPPPTTAYMLQSPTKPVQYQWVPASQIAEPMRHAVIAAEDQKFWLHHGFDYEAIQQAEEYNRDSSHRRRGASTISQQTAKNLFLWPGGWVRKGIEAGLTVLIEQLWGKPRILEMYLNVAEFGPGVYGVGAAAQAYFGKPASQLTADEAARLAAVLPNPRHWSARDPGAYVQSRATWILGQMGYGGIGAPREEPLAPASELQGADEDEALQAQPDAPAPAPEAPPATAPGDVPADAPAGAPAATPDTPPAATPPAPQDGAQTPPANPDVAPASTATPAAAPPPPANPPASAPPPAAPQ